MAIANAAVGTAETLALGLSKMTNSENLERFTKEKENRMADVESFG